MAIGVKAEMEFAFAGLHQLCGRMLDRLDRLPGPSFHPPADCGPYQPGYAPPPHPCALVGETPGHVAVYTGDEPMLPQKTMYYARMGRSVVTLADSNTGSPPSRDLAMTVFSSLERRSAAQLREMNARVRPRD